MGEYHPLPRFLAALGIVAARFLDPLALANLLMLCSLGILLVRGTYFQPEPLYYITFFIAAVCSWRILRAPKIPIWLYPVFEGSASDLRFFPSPRCSHISPSSSARSP